MLRQNDYPARIVILLALNATQGSELREPKDISFNAPTIFLLPASSGLSVFSCGISAHSASLR